MTKQWAIRIGMTALSLAIAMPDVMSVSGQAPVTSGQRESAAVRGQTTTQLPDGQWLIVGGEGVERRAALWDPQSGTATPTVGTPLTVRAWHSATVMADGRVLIAGGRGTGGATETPEIFDAATGLFTPVPIAGATPRAFHTATLLTDGRILVAGGSTGAGKPLPTEVWDVQAQILRRSTVHPSVDPRTPRPSCPTDAYS